MFKNLKFNFDSETALNDAKNLVKKNYNKIIDILDKDDFISPYIKMRENTKRTSYTTKNTLGYSINIEVPGYTKANINVELDEIRNVLCVSGTNENGSNKEKFSDEFFIDIKTYNVGSITLMDGILSIQIIDIRVKEEVKETPKKKFNID